MSFNLDTLVRGCHDAQLERALRYTAEFRKERRDHVDDEKSSRSWLRSQMDWVNLIGKDARLFSFKDLRSRSFQSLLN